jgi:hypothetical protein
MRKINQNEGRWSDSYHEFIFHSGKEMFNQGQTTNMPTKGDIKQVEGCTDYLQFNGKRWHRFHENGKDAGIGVWAETDEMPRWFLRPRARRG